MIRRRILFLLCVLPVIFFILEILLMHTRGEYYLFDNYDGQYGYLLAGLNIADMNKPGYTQHPGIIPLLIIAFTIKVSHLLNGNNAAMIIDVFNRPEFYLHRVNIVFNLMNAISMFILGYFTYKKTKNLPSAIFLQLTPFVSVMIIYEMTLNIPESILVILINLLLALIISYQNEVRITKEENRKYVLMFGIIAGLMLATKISILPLLIIPFLVIGGYRYKLFFIAVSSALFAILFVIISPELSTIWKFVFNNIVHSGKYGEGSKSIVDSSQILPKLKLLYNEFFLFCLTYVITFLILIASLIPRLKRVMQHNRYYLILIGIFISMTAYVLLVIKQNEGYYVMPGLLMTVMALFSINSIMTDLFPKAFKKTKYLYLFLFFIIFSWSQIKAFQNYGKFFHNRKIESYKARDFMQNNFNDKLIISTDRATSMPTAFYNALNYTGNSTDYYNDLLLEKYPDYIYFQRWRKDFIYLNRSKEQQENLMNADTVIFHSFTKDDINTFKEKLSSVTLKKNINYKEVFANKNGERVYVIDLKE